MLDELYDDVLSVMKEHGFIDWFNKNHPDKPSPLKWCYDRNNGLKTPPKPPKDIKWLVYSHDDLINYPIKLEMDNEGVVGPNNT